MTVGHRVCAELDPLLTPLGFAPGQGGADDGPLSVVFCAAPEDLAARLPWLAELLAEDIVEVGTIPCWDMVVEADDAGLARVDIEGLTLVEILRGLDLRSDADAIAAQMGRSVDAALPVLAEVLRRLFAAPGDRGGSRAPGAVDPPR